MVTVLLNSSPKYSLAIILGCAWLLLTSIIFISSYFKTKKEDITKGGITPPIAIYILLTLVTMLAFAFGWFESDEKKKENIEKVEVVENSRTTREDSFFQNYQ